MMKFIHLTDTHVLERGQLLYGLDPVHRVRMAIESINREHSDAEFVLHTGDMTEFGSKADFDVFAEEMARLQMPVHLTMGNHDEIETFAAHFPDISRDENGFAQSTFDTPYGRFLILDSHIPLQSGGGYCAGRRAWLKDQLESSEGPIFLSLHHPPLELGIYGMDIIGFEEADEFYAVLEPHKERIRHIFFGHVHRVIFGNWRGISYSCMRGTNHQVALDLKEKNPLILGNLENPAYGVVLVDEHNVTVHMHDFSDRSPRFNLDTADGKYKDYALGMRHPGFHYAAGK